MSAVMARVISQKGTCEAQYMVGDEFVVGGKTPPQPLSRALLLPFPFCSGPALWRFFPLGARPKQSYHCLSRPRKSVCLNSDALRLKR
jgi:hypothetical protein